MAPLVKLVDLKKSPPNRKLVGLVFIMTGLISGFFWLKSQPPEKISYQLEDEHINSVRDTSRPTSTFVSELKQNLMGVNGQYAVYVFRLQEGKGYGLNEDMSMPAASIMKVPIMVAAFRAIDAGKLHSSDTYVLADADKESGSGPLEFLDAGTSLTVDYLLQVTGQNSDNTAPAVLVRMLGADQIQDTIKDLGMTDTSFADNGTTAYDMSVMWKNLYAGKLLTPASRDKLFSYLQGSIYEDRIPLGLPPNTQLIHKVGSGDNIWTDAGIIMTDPPFVLVILDKNIDATEANTTVPKLSKMVWDFESARTTPPPPTPTTPQSK